MKRITSIGTPIHPARRGFLFKLIFMHGPDNSSVNDLLMFKGEEKAERLLKFFSLYNTIKIEDRNNREVLKKIEHFNEFFNFGGLHGPSVLEWPESASKTASKTALLLCQISCVYYNEHGQECPVSFNIETEKENVSKENIERTEAT